MSWWGRLRESMRSNDEIASEDRRRLASEQGCDAVGDCADRSRVTLRGTIEVLTVRPRQDVPWLEAELSDGTGKVTLIWMGRRAIPGIDAGRDLIVKGRISTADGGARMYNPDYELL